MQAFFCPDQLLHTPQQFMRLGRLHKPADVPARAEALHTMLTQLGVPVHLPPEAGLAALQAVHSPAYLAYLATAFERWQALKMPGVEPGPEVLPNLGPALHVRRDLARGDCPSPSIVAQTGWYISDLACPIGPQTWRSILRAAHTALAAAEAVCVGEPLAYALCRPSGHHAQWDRAGGFCYVNNAAVATQRLAQQFGRVAVLDVDAHHGDGTQQIFYDRADVLTVSTHADTDHYYPFYSGRADERGVGAGLGHNLNLPLAHGSGNAEFFTALDAGVAAVRAHAPAALVLCMGFDTFGDDPLSVLKLDHAAYRAVGQRVRALGLPTVVVQEGGYMVEALGPGLQALLDGLGA
jgi:acetoin utilization deacetylase AcuC-like enzyme